MLLCLPLFLGFATEAQAQAECVSEDLLDHVEAKIEIEPTDRWVRIKNALTEQSNPIALFEVKEIYERRKANGWNLNRFDDVVAAMECLAKPKPGGLEADDAPQACVSPALAADVKGYSEETWHGSAHVERWLRVLQTFSGTANDSTVMTPAEAQEMADRWSNGRWDPVVDALQCLEVEALNDQTEVQAEEPEDTPLPLQAEETPMPAQSPGSLRVYFHGGTRAPGAEYRINEDDHWESELIIHYSGSANLVNTFCVNREIWGGPDHWNNGPITLPGFDTYIAATDQGSVILGVDGHWQCINDETGSDSVTDSPYVSLVPGSTTDFVYRATVRTRDNNVVEDDFSIADDLEFRFGTTFSGKTKWGPETEEMPDRVWWRLLDDNVAWPDRADWCLGTGSRWDKVTNPTCGKVSESQYVNRAPNLSGNCNNESHADALVRADDAVGWLPDHCYETQEVVKIPPTPSNTQPGVTFNNTEIPIIEEDDVSWINLHKQNGKWTVSVYKPVMVTDGEDCSAEEAEQQADLDAQLATATNNTERNIVRSNFEWNFDDDCDLWWKTDQGLVMSVDSRVVGSSGAIDVMIPAVNGVVKDIDYLLHDLQKVAETDIERIDNPSTTLRNVGPYSETCDYQQQPGGAGVPRQYLSATARASGMVTGTGKHFEIAGPPINSDLCD